MGHLVTLATCSLNQWALDFEGNCERIIESIRQAKKAGATLRVGPELEITGNLSIGYDYKQGCDGDRLYYDGCAMIVVNGNIVAQGSQFSLNDVEVVTATVDIEEVRTYRSSASRGMQASKQTPFVRLDLDMRLSRQNEEAEPGLAPSETIAPRYHAPEEEVALGPACWLWDYLRRSGAAGFFLPLSGGIDSCATAIIVHSMCREVIKAVSEGNEQVIKDVRRLCAEPADSTWLPTTSQEVCNRIFHTSYMGTQNSSKETRDRAKRLSTDIGSYHIDFNFDTVITSLTNLFTMVTNFQPKFKVHGGSRAENQALQNVQARLRMVLSYLFASLLPTVRQRPGGGGLLVLASSNVDVDLKKFIAWSRDSFEIPILHEFLNATPTAELEPITSTYVQSDEADMGVTYAELSTFGYLRKVAKLGPWSMYERLLHVWGNEYSPREIYEKTRHFFYNYAINRHKMTVITPSYHAEQYSPDDNRHDLRQFLYPSFTWAYKKMEDSVKFWESKGWTAGKAQKKNVKAD
ncbi:hypothetical protein APSETT444_002243 [Aspergillus pseudonomiae]